MDKLELVIFDMDGVLADITSSWKYIHDYFHTSNERSVDQYLRGKIDDLEFIRRDISLWKENGKPIKKEKLLEILSTVPIMNGAYECTTYLKQKNIKTAIISAGLDILAETIAQKLEINYYYANGIITNEEGRLNGEGTLNVKLMYKEQKVQELTKKLNIPLRRVAAIGNSCFDIPMFKISGLGIAFNPRDNCTRKSADIVVEEKNLKKVIPFLENY